MEGYLEGMTQHYPGQSARTFIMHDLPYRLSTGRLLMEKARQQYPDSDLFIFSSDLFATGALLSCQRAGIKVPSELAIIGFGDYEMSQELLPALTTVAVPTTRIGQDAARIILQRLKGGKAGPRKVDLGFELVARESA
jgi:LacI family gluconate utilization system Gnt-I transcriptional repressor